MNIQRNHSYSFWIGMECLDTCTSGWLQKAQRWRNIHLWTAHAFCTISWTTLDASFTVIAAPFHPRDQENSCHLVLSHVMMDIMLLTNAPPLLEIGNSERSVKRQQGCQVSHMHFEGIGHSISSIHKEGNIYSLVPTCSFPLCRKSPLMLFKDSLRPIS